MSFAVSLSLTDLRCALRSIFLDTAKDFCEKSQPRNGAAGIMLVESKDPDDLGILEEKAHRTIHIPTSFELWRYLGLDDVRLRKRLFVVMESPGMQVFLITLLLLSLFITDSWTLGDPNDSSNIILDILLTIVLAIFFLEVLILSYCEPNYFHSFFFYMDILGTASIILDISFISSGFLPSGTQASGNILRATRTAKLGARYGRLMRVLKLIRFIEYIPGFRKTNSDPEPTASSLRKVTSQLSGIISQRVAAMVMIIVIVVPFLKYEGTDYSTDAWLKNLKVVAKDTSYSSSDLENMANRFQRFYRHKDVRLVSLTIDSPYSNKQFSNEWDDLSDIRASNLLKFEKDYKLTSSSTTTYSIEAIMDYTIPNKFDAMCGILLVTLVILVLIVFSASFQNQVEKLVVAPLEKMMNTLRSSATVMLKSMNVIEKEKGDNESDDDDDDDEEGEMETLLLEKMVEKLTKIITLTYPGANDIDISDDVDTATASWLNQSYSSNRKVSREFNIIVNDDDDDNDDDDMSDRDEDPLYDLELIRLSKLSTTYSTKINNFDALESWDFDVLNYSEEELFEIFVYIYDVLYVFDEFQVPDVIFASFLREVASRYINNTYHNFKHGCDVAYTVYRLIKDSSVYLILSQLEIYALMTAALGHDIGHPGVNNGYLVNSKHQFALQHNDRSPLENMHCAVMYEILTQSNTNIFLSLGEKQWREARKIILTTILGTDMAHHFEQISKTQLFFEVNKADIHAFCAGDKNDITVLNEEKDRYFVLELCLHCADISNAYKPFHICAKWADLVVEEFSLQGDKEKAEGLDVSPMMDRSTINLNNMQLGFIEFVVSPLILALINIFYPLHPIGQYILTNFQEWAKRRRDEIFADSNIMDKEEECRKLEERVKKFKDKFDILEELKARPTRSAKNTVRIPKSQARASSSG